MDNDHHTIEIIKIFNVENERYVAYLKNNIPAYIHFKKDYLGNYKFFNDEYGTYNENDKDTNLQDFVIPRGYKDDQPLPLKLFVITNKKYCF